MRTIWASQIREFIFCPYSLGCRMRGIVPPAEALGIKEERCNHGNLFHRNHGEAVCQAERQLGIGGFLIRFGLAAVIVGGFAWLLIYI